MIDYSIFKQTNTNSPTLDNVHAKVQIRQHLSTEDLAEHIASHGSKYTPGDLQAVIYELTTCVKELVLGGNKVDVGILGSFEPDLNSQGFGKSGKKPEEFTADDIRGVTLRWRKPKALRNLRAEAVLNAVVTRKEQATGIKNVRSGLVDTTQGGSGSGM